MLHKELIQNYIIEKTYKEYLVTDDEHNEEFKVIKIDSEFQVFKQIEENRYKEILGMDKYQFLSAFEPERGNREELATCIENCRNRYDN
jgi:hypothetical protein